MCKPHAHNAIYDRGELHYWEVLNVRVVGMIFCDRQVINVSIVCVFIVSRVIIT